MPPILMHRRGYLADEGPGRAPRRSDGAHQVLPVRCPDCHAGPGFACVDVLDLMPRDQCHPTRVAYADLVRLHTQGLS